MSERYPLEAARTVRAGTQERAERALADARRALEAAREATRDHQRALEACRVEHASGRARAPEPRNGAALHRDLAFRAHLDAEETRCVRAVATARAAEQRAARSVRDARRALGLAHAEGQVIEEHRERWVEDQRRAAERAEDEALEEISRA